MIDTGGARTLFAASAVTGLGALALGLPGPFILDDPLFLDPVTQALQRGQSWADALSEGVGGPLGRPLTLISFGVNAGVCGLDAPCLRAGNIALHLVNALLFAAVAARLFARDATLRAHAAALGWLAAAAWLALPLHTPTVLYVGQRFALLASTFVLLGLWAFMVARERIEHGRGGVALLWIGVPAATVLAALAKENGALLPPMCLVLELVLFAPRAERPRPAPVAWFFRLGVFTPALLAAGWLAAHPELLGDYGQRPFTLTDRVLTQGRVLWDYVVATFAPSARRIGVFQDDYVVSRGLLEPATTLVAWLAWLGTLVAALACVRRLPVATAGLGLFAVGHALESTVFALEIYFAHRNYLPSTGLVIAAVALGSTALARTGLVSRRVLAAAVLAWIVFCLATTARLAYVWADHGRLLAHEAALHPASLRVRGEQIAVALNAGRGADALRTIDAIEPLAPASQRRTVALWRLLTLCIATGDFSAEQTTAVRQLESDRLSYDTGRALVAIVDRVEPGTCAPGRRLDMAALLETWIATSVQSERSAEIAQARYLRARLLAAAGHMRTAQVEARRAFEARGDFNFGVLAFQISASLGDIPACRAILAELRRHAGWRTPGRRAIVRRLAEFLPPA